VKVAHFLRYGKHQAGIYGTARDLILAERMCGIDAQAIDFGGPDRPLCSRVGIKDGDVTTVAPEWAKSADVLVRHSIVPVEIQKLNIPTILTLHGTPEYTYRLELAGKNKVLREVIQSAAKATAILTFWKEHIFEWQTLLNGREIHYCPPTVNLKEFNPDGKKYDLGADTINIVSTGVWRNEYRLPYQAIWAAAELVAQDPRLKLYVFACPAKKGEKEAPTERLMHQLKKAGLVERAVATVNNLPEIYRGADIALSAHTVASRTVREALACGCPVVAETGNKFTPYTANSNNRHDFMSAIKLCIEDIKKCKEEVRQTARHIAEDSFGLKQAGNTKKGIFEKILISNHT